MFLIVDGHPIHKARESEFNVEGLDGKLNSSHARDSDIPTHNKQSGLDVKAEGFTPVGRECRGDEKRLALAHCADISEAP